MQEHGGCQAQLRARSTGPQQGMPTWGWHCSAHPQEAGESSAFPTQHPAHSGASSQPTGANRTLCTSKGAGYKIKLIKWLCPETTEQHLKKLKSCKQAGRTNQQLISWSKGLMPAAQSSGGGLPLERVHYSRCSRSDRSYPAAVPA